MAHIPDGVLSSPVLIGGAVAAATMVAVGIRGLDLQKIPQTALLSAAFFVASLVTVPVGPTGVHLLLNGLMGLVLGWAAVPAILVALALQAALFGFGGLTALGVNTVNLALPAVLVAIVLAPALRNGRWPRNLALLGGLAGFLGTASTAAMVCLSLALSGPEYVPALGVVAATYLPLIVVETAVTAAAVVLVAKVKPDLLGVEAPAHG